MKTRIFSLLLVLCMLCSMLPYPVWALEDAENDSLTWSLDRTGTLTISGTGPMQQTPWLDCRDEIRKVVISEGITSIVDQAFYACSNMQTITIPDSVTEIGSYAFAWSALDNIVFEGSAPIIAENAFSGVDGVVFYPADDETWTSEIVQNYEGTLTWTDISIVSIDVEDVTIMQYSDGYESRIYDEVTGEEIGTYYHYNYDPDFTVTMASGAVYQGESGWIDIEFISFDLIHGDDQNEHSPWEPGDHEVIATLGQAETTFTVTIQEHPVDWIAVEPITLYEGVDGWMDSYWDEEQQEWVDNSWFHYEIAPRTTTICYKDGTQLTGTRDEIDELTGQYVYYTDPQDYTAQWGVGDYMVTAEYMGITCNYQVTILDNPVERIEVEPITLREGIDGYMDGYWDEKLEEWVDNAWFRYDISPQTVTIYYKDGTSLTGSLFEIEEQTGYYVSYLDPQDYTTAWEPGTHTAAAAYMGVTYEYQITIEENPVERIEVEPITLMEGTNGYWDSGWDENQQAWIPDTWYHYHTSPEKMTVYYKDGTSFAGYMYEIEEQTGTYPTTYDDQDESAPWQPGVHTATVYFLGCTYEYEVTIQENNVARIEAASVILLEGVDGNWDGYWDDDRGEWIEVGWFRYNPLPQQITVYYKDGTSQTGSVYDMEDQEGGYVTSSDDQDYTAQWDIGSYTARAQFMGRTCEYQVTIQENNVADIEVAPLILYEGVNGYQYDGWFEYDTNPKTMTVYYKDGTSETCSVSDIVAQTGAELSVSDNQSDAAPWGVGTYTATARFMGHSCEFQVNILENPIASVSLIQMPEKMVYRMAEWIDLKGAVLRVAFTDGTWEDVQINRSTASVSSYYQQYPIAKLGNKSRLLLSEVVLSNPGSQTISLVFAGKSCEFTVEVQESSITGIAIQSPDGQKLQIVANHEDGSTEQFNVLWLDDNLGDGTDEYVMVGEDIITDQGTFIGRCYQMHDGGMYVELHIGPGGECLRSNILYGCRWLGNWERIENYAGIISSMNSCGDSFTGELNAENVDKLVETARFFYKSHNSFYTNDIMLSYTLVGHNFVYSGAEIRKALEALFGISNADLSVSNYYDPVTDAYTAQGEGWGMGPIEVPPKFVEENGRLWVTVTLETGTKVRMALDDEYRITTYYLFDGDHGHDYENGTCVICGAVYSGNLQIVTQPMDYVGLVGDNTTFSVSADGEGIKYQWYFSKNGGSTWEKTSSTNNVISVEFKAYRNNYLYRCEITDVNGNIVISNSAKLIAREVALAITKQPENFVGAVNDDVTFTVEATGNGLVYEWFFSNDGGNTWAKSYSPGYMSNSLAPILRSHRDGNSYKCVVSDVFGNSVTSNVVSMSVKTSEIVITSQPADVKNAVLGRLYQFSVAAEGDNLTYRWQVSSDGGITWTESWNQGYNTATLGVRMNANRDCNMYRCVVTSGLKTVLISDAGILDLQDPSVKIISQSGNVAIVANQTATFTVEAEGTDLTYQWYRSNDKGATWNQTYLSGYNTATIRFVATTNRTAMYMCKITDGSGKAIWTDPVKLTIVSVELKILTQPSNVTCAAGERATFTVEAQGDTLKYQWYASSDGGSTWTVSYLTGYNTNEFSFVVNTARAAKLYKCVITDVAGNTVETDAVTVTIG